MKVSKEYKIGLLVFIGGIFTFMLVNLLKSGLDFGQRNEYYVIFDNASGLKAGNEVQLNGVKIGEVLDVSLHPNNPTKILTKFSIDNTDLEIPKNSEAWLISSDILGTKCLDLRLDTSSTKSGELLARGDTLNSRKEMTLEEEIKAELDPLKTKTEMLVSRVEGIIVEINQLWDSSASYTFEESIYEAREAIGTYQELVRNLTNLINRESQMVTTIAGHMKIVKDSVLHNMNDISAISQNMTSVKTDLSAPGLLTEIANLNGSMTSMNALITQINNGEGTYGALTKTTEFQTELKSTQESMNLLLKSISEDPMKYVGISLLGKKIEGLQLTPEEEKKLEEWLSH